MIHQTIYQNEGSTRTQRDMPLWAYRAICRWADVTANTRFTKGVIAYECLLLDSDEYEDSFTSIEKFVDDELSQEVGTHFVETLNKTRFASHGAAETHLADLVGGHDPYEVHAQANLHFPDSLAEQFEGRGLGDEIAAGVRHAEAAPWSSRMERADVKRQIIALAREEAVDDPHEFVQALIDQDSSRWDIGDLIAELDNSEWWEDPSQCTLGRIKSSGEVIPQNKITRQTALQLAVDNHNGSVTEGDILDVVVNGLGVSTKPYAQNKYVDEINFDGHGGVELHLVSSAVETVAAHVRDGFKSAHRIHNVPDYALLRLPKEVLYVDGVYESPEAALEASERALDMYDPETQNGVVFIRAHSQFKKMLRNSMDGFAAFHGNDT